MEYAVVIIVILGVLIAMQKYVKRGIQGRWKASVDELGEQYDPRRTNSVTTSFINSSANTIVSVADSMSGKYTSRQDITSSTENRVSNTEVGSM